MKVITIKQPWATLIAKGYKEYEFRTWQTKYRGDILIHAGKSIDEAAMKRFQDYNLDYPLGVIIAKAKITDCVLADDKFRQKYLAKEPNVYHNLKRKDKNLYGFKLEEVKEIEPIKISGQLGLWNYEK